MDAVWTIPRIFLVRPMGHGYQMFFPWLSHWCNLSVLMGEGGEIFFMNIEISDLGDGGLLEKFTCLHFHLCFHPSDIIVNNYGWVPTSVPTFTTHY